MKPRNDNTTPFACADCGGPRRAESTVCRPCSDKRTSERNRAARMYDDRLTPCSCGCGAILAIDGARYNRNKSKAFYVDRAHQSAAALERAKRLRTRTDGVARYGPDWPGVAAAIRERDGVCRTCGMNAAENGRPLDVHHVVPFRVCLAHDPENLIALCRMCHLVVTRSMRAFDLPVPKPVYKRTCSVCDRVFETENPRWKVCGASCKNVRRARFEREYWQRQAAAGSEAYQRKREGVRAWAADNHDRLRATQRASYHRKKSNPGAGQLALPID